MEEINFPNKDELIVANALLLLHRHFNPSSSSPSPSPFLRSICNLKKAEAENENEDEDIESMKTITKTVSCDDDSIVTTTEQYSVITADQFMITPSPPSSTFVFQVARRARSKVICLRSRDRKQAPSNWTKQAPVERKGKGEMSSDTAAEGSCLTTGGTSEVTSGRGRKRRSQVVEQKRRRRLGFQHTHIGRRADAIIGLLSSGERASEVRIRQVLGDSPDTSKALRLLLRMEQVQRSGAGGRADPFIYMIAATTD